MSTIDTRLSCACGEINQIRSVLSFHFLLNLVSEITLENFHEDIFFVYARAVAGLPVRVFGISFVDR